MIELIALVACCVIAFFVGQWAGSHPEQASGAASSAWARIRDLFKRKE